MPPRTYGGDAQDLNLRSALPVISRVRRSIVKLHLQELERWRRAGLEPTILLPCHGSAALSLSYIPTALVSPRKRQYIIRLVASIASIVGLHRTKIRD